MKLLKFQLKKKKSLLIILVVVGLITTAGFLLWDDPASAAEYTTAKVERGNLRNTVTATGTLQAVTTVQVGSQSSGTISALFADFNSTVKKGQIVAQLDPSTTQAQVEQARANLAQARAQLVQARSGVSDANAKALAANSTTQNQQAGVSSAEANLNVLKAQLDNALSNLHQQESLQKSGLISQRDLETAQMNYKTAEARYDQAAAQLKQAVLSESSAAGAGQAQAQAQLEQAKAQVQNASAQVQQAEAALELAQINLTHTTIRSPIDGVVVSRNVDVGQTVAASLSAPTLFTIANDLTQMQVIANIDEADIGLVEKAKGAKFSVDAFPSQEFTGAIKQIRLNPVTAQNVVTYNVVMDVSNPEQKLKPGMTANLTITIDERNNVLKIPNSALRFMPQISAEQRAEWAKKRADGENRTGGENGQGSGRRAGRQGTENGNGTGEGATQAEGARVEITPATSPVLEGQMRRVWILGQNNKPQMRRIKIGLSDGTSTEILEGDLNEGDTVITGQNIADQQNRPQQRGGQSTPGFGGGSRGGFSPGGRR